MDLLPSCWFFFYCVYIYNIAILEDLVSLKFWIYHL
uniref:Uncharacterized protein n=1 Tax=Aegilops tauschii subsp. strangulata TaxID=200361 RepID=A0A453BMV0_AEGTS